MQMRFSISIKIEEAVEVATLNSNGNKSKVYRPIQSEATKETEVMAQ